MICFTRRCGVYRPMSASAARSRMVIAAASSPCHTTLPGCGQDTAETLPARHNCERFGGEACRPGRPPPVSVRPKVPTPGERPRQVFSDDHAGLVHHGVHRPVGHRGDLLFPAALLPLFFDGAVVVGADPLRLAVPATPGGLVSDRP